MAVKRKQTRPEIALRRLERVLHEAEGEMPRALVRMPDDAVKETERIEESMRRLERLSWREKFTMARDPKTDGYMLDMLSRDKDVVVRCNVARNRNVSVEILERLSRDKDAGVRYNVAGSRNVSVEILERLSRDKDVLVRSGVAGNENVSLEILERLSRDKDAGVRYNVAGSRNASVEILERLKNDSDKYVRDMAIKTLEKINRGSEIM